MKTEESNAKTYLLGIFQFFQNGFKNSMVKNAKLAIYATLLLLCGCCCSYSDGIGSSCSSAASAAIA